MSGSDNQDLFKQRLARLEGRNGGATRTPPPAAPLASASGSNPRKKPSATAWFLTISLFAVGGGGAVYASLPKGSSDMLDGLTGLASMVVSDTFQADTLDLLVVGEKRLSDTFNKPILPDRGPELASPFLLTMDQTVPNETTSQAPAIQVTDIAKGFIPVTDMTKVAKVQFMAPREVCTVEKPTSAAAFVNIRLKSSSQFTPVNLSYRSQVAKTLSERIDKSLTKNAAFDDNFPMPRGMYPVDVFLTDTSTPQYVVLQAVQGQDVIWNLQVGIGVTIERVVIVGSGSSGVANVPEGVEIDVLRASDFANKKKTSRELNLERLEKARASYERSRQREADARERKAILKERQAERDAKANAPRGLPSGTAGNSFKRKTLKSIKVRKKPAVAKETVVADLAPKRSLRPLARKGFGKVGADVCTLTPWRMPQDHWVAWQKAAKNNTLYQNQMQTFTKGYANYSGWFEETFGLDAQTNILTAASASHVLAGPFPELPMAYASLDGATVRATNEHFALVGTSTERRTQNYEIHSDMLMTVTGGNLASLYQTPVSLEAAQ